ncbi:hypothetical protein ACFY12_24260 [Streptomyces sp. NPDC001339]|uniref:hypothetical protein n=1 Tax=Streptomyces sp. NPDC001339 TaxID=3364563 RepID=UPI00369EF368
MTTPKPAGKRPGKAGTTKTSSSPATKTKSRPSSKAKGPARPAGKATTTSPKSPQKSSKARKKTPTAQPAGHTISVTVPPLGDAATKAVAAAAVPVEVARRALPAKGGLPLYLGLGALGVVGALDWPVAVGIGIGYAILRHDGPLTPPSHDKPHSGT